MLGERRQMTSHEAKNILRVIKRQVRDQKVAEAITVAMSALTWQEIEEKKRDDPSISLGEA